MAEADVFYSRLLKSIRPYIMQVGVSNFDDHTIDSCLLAILIMGRYEGIIHCTKDASFKGSFASLRSWSHHDGSMAVVRQWYDGAQRRKPTTIIKQIRRGLIKSTILRILSLPDWILDGNDFGETGSDLDFDQILVRLTVIRSRIVSHEEGSMTSTEDVGKISEEIEDLDRRLQVWITQMSNISDCQQHILAGVGDQPVKHLYSPVVYSFPSLNHAGFWTLYFCTRMLVNSTHLTLVEAYSSHLSYNADSQYLRQHCLDQIQTLSDSLASTIPFCLGKLRCDEQAPSGCELKNLPQIDEDIEPHAASLVVWPLTIASSIGGIIPRQLEWFKSELASMGCITGDGILECAVSDQWAVL